MASSSSAGIYDTAAAKSKAFGDHVGHTYLDHNEDDAYKMVSGAVAQKYQGTAADRKDMSQLGRVQELRRNFNLLSMVGFACTLIATWEVLLTTLTTSLTDEVPPDSSGASSSW